MRMDKMRKVKVRNVPNSPRKQIWRLFPEDLEKEFTNHKGSMEFFDSLSKSSKKILLYWVISAKRTETRQKRILEIAENASKNLKPKQFR